MKSIFALLTVLLFITFLPVNAQEPQEEQAKAAEALAKEAQNPVANLNTIPIQFNFYTGGGFGDQTMVNTNIQPVLPLRINENYNIISRTVIPIVNIPLGDTARVYGVSDIQEQLYFSPIHPKKLIWGIGPVFSFPTATRPELATGQFALGPTFVALKMSKKWVYGILANNLWRIAGGENTTPINSLFLQYFINYNLKKGWAISTSPALTANWQAAEGQQWTVPFGLGVSKITMIGKQPLNLSLQYYNNVIRPDAAGQNLIRFNVAFMFPNKR